MLKFPQSSCFQSVVHGQLGVSYILSGGLLSQSYFHCNTKMLFLFLTLMTFILMI